MTYSEMARDVLAFMDRVVCTGGVGGTSDVDDGRGDGCGGGGDGRAVLVGHSMGGKVAQCLALMHPDRVAGLVVLDIAPVRYRSSNVGEGGTVEGGGRGGDGTGWRAVEEIVRSVSSLDLRDFGAQATRRDVDRALRARSSTLEDPALRAFVLTNLEHAAATAVAGDRGGAAATAGKGGTTDVVVDDDDADAIDAVPNNLRWKVNWDGIVNELDSIAGFDVHDRAMDDGVAVETTPPSSSSDGGIGAPRVNDDDDDDEGICDDTRRINVRYDGDVFFIHGGASRFVRHSHMATIASYFPNHMLTTIRGSGHWVHAEAPDDTIALLKRYLDR
jgi:pimeloyl-ACP methyl ester carboxylesterase